MDTRTVACAEGAFNDRAKRRLKVGVLVDLALGPRAGGHVRCWERLAQAALDFADTLDLTVHFMGATEERRLGETVRYRLDPPVFSTERLIFLSHVPDHTDLAPRHRRVERWLRNYDVIHTTGAHFAYARSAMRIGKQWKIPIVNSVHTNTPEYAHLFTAQTIDRLFGTGAIAHLLLDRIKVPERVQRQMLRQLADHQRRCAFVLVSRPDQLEPVRALVGDRAGLLRRGIDHRMFDPAKRDRGWLERCFAIPLERFVVLCAGRLNRGKNVLLLADAMAELIAAGIDAQLVCAGEGDDRAEILQRLGERATCPGNVEAPALARLYASSDLFAFPSRIEESANVVPEALASGLPVLVTRESGMGRVVAEGHTGMILPGDDARPWTAALAMLAADAARRQLMSISARRYAERSVPSWSEVLAEDLLPRWHEAAGVLHRRGASAAA